jgi:hypothetical protein
MAARTDLSSAEVLVERRPLLVDEAAQLAALAHHIEVFSVVVEKLRGATWQEIANGLGVTKGSAHQRFARRVKGWELSEAEQHLDDLWQRVGQLNAARVGRSR